SEVPYGYRIARLLLLHIVVELPPAGFHQQRVPVEVVARVQSDGHFIRLLPRRLALRLQHSQLLEELLEIDLRLLHRSDSGARRQGGGGRGTTRRRRRLGVVELLKPLVDGVDVVLGVEVEEAAGGHHGRVPLGGKPLEPYGGLAAVGAEVGKVEVGVGAVEAAGSLVVGQSRLLGGGEGAEPEAGPLPGLPDLGHPLAPRPLPDSAVLAGGVLGAAFAAGGALALLPRPEGRLSEVVVH
ncbi:unnamed protein product, partial [Musa acuminata var. zebrina]